MTTMTPEQKARKVALGAISAWKAMHLKCDPGQSNTVEGFMDLLRRDEEQLANAITTALLQFAREQESEAVEELVAGLETALEGFRPPFAGDDTLLPIKVEKAKHLQALVARHSKKGVV